MNHMPMSRGIKPQGMPQESMGGAVPQSGVNPQMQRQQAIPPAQGQSLPPWAIDNFRNDPEIREAISMVIGGEFDMSKIPDDVMIGIAGLVQTMGVRGAVDAFLEKAGPQVLQQLKSI